MLPMERIRMKRLAVYLFFDEHGIVDDYVLYMLAALAEDVDRSIVVCNGAPDAAGLARLEAIGVEVMVRENTGFDVYGYKECIEQIGRAEMARYDELLLMNYTFFGPLFPLRELFDEMDSRNCDFWGITAHGESASPFDPALWLPFHIQSHFIAVRGRLLASDEFWDYWRTMPAIESYRDSVLHHEARFTRHFADRGFDYSVYMDPQSFSTEHPVFIEVDRTIEMRCPIIKRRAFFHDPLYLEAEAIDLRGAMDRIEAGSDYPIDLIWRNIVRATEPRTLYTNLEMLDVFPSTRLESAAPKWAQWRIAVLVHLFYPEMADEIGASLTSIPLPVDVYVTTDTLQKQARIESSLSRIANIGKLEVRVMESNTGRDTSALLIGCRDVVLEGEYDLICRLHGKKSPQDGVNRGGLFKRHLIENLLGSRGYVENVFDLAAREPAIGILMPPVMHIGYPTLGHGWFSNRPMVASLARELGLKVKFDLHTPLAPLGSMYWFRPKALEPLFRKRWTWSDFERSGYGDGDLPHAIERLVTYCAQSQGFLAWCIMTPRMVAKNYVKLEYKYQVLASCFQTGDARGQVAAMLQRMNDLSTPTASQSFRAFLAALKRSIRYRFDRLMRLVG